jgi:anti-sigma factor RsiW
MTHLGQRLSALIDGELDTHERAQVIWHLARCGSCQDEAAALQTLKRRMHALGEAAAGAALTGRLMGLSSASVSGSDLGWPQDAMDWAASRGQRPDAQRPDARPQRYFLAGSLVVFLAGLGTAAFIAGGDSQAQSPAPAVTPQVGVYTMEHDDMNGLFMDPPVEPAPAVPGGESRPGLRP